MFFTTGILMTIYVVLVFVMLKILQQTSDIMGVLVGTAAPSHFLTGFDTVDEVIKYLYDVYNLYADEVEKAEEDIKHRLYWFHYDRGEYEEAQKFQC